MVVTGRFEKVNPADVETSHPGGMSVTLLDLDPFRARFSDGRDDLFASRLGSPKTLDATTILRRSSVVFPSKGELLACRSELSCKLVL
jgi:hypothetical protein